MRQKLDFHFKNDLEPMIAHLRDMMDRVYVDASMHQAIGLPPLPYDIVVVNSIESPTREQVGIHVLPSEAFVDWYGAVVKLLSRAAQR